MRSKPYLGITRDGARVVFRSPAIPTRETHGDRFAACVGPFRTARGARFMRDYGRGNPHCRCVADAERLARLDALDAASRLARRDAPDATRPTSPTR